MRRDRDLGKRPISNRDEMGTSSLSVKRSVNSSSTKSLTRQVEKELLGCDFVIRSCPEQRGRKPLAEEVGKMATSELFRFCQISIAESSLPCSCLIHSNIKLVSAHRGASDSGSTSQPRVSLLSLRTHMSQHFHIVSGLGVVVVAVFSTSAALRG